MLRPNINSRAEGPEALESAPQEALAADAPSLIEVPVSMIPTRQSPLDKDVRDVARL